MKRVVNALGADCLRRFSDLTDEESASVLDCLRRHKRREPFTCRCRWRGNDPAFRKNPYPTHPALDGYPGKRRAMQRATIEGDRPV